MYSEFHPLRIHLYVDMYPLVEVADVNELFLTYVLSLSLFSLAVVSGAEDWTEGRRRED